MLEVYKDLQHNNEAVSIQRYGETIVIDQGVNELCIITVCSFIRCSVIAPAVR